MSLSNAICLPHFETDGVGVLPKSTIFYNDMTQLILVFSKGRQCKFAAISVYLC